MIVAVLRSGTKPGLQAVWHNFLCGLPAFGLLEAIGGVAHAVDRHRCLRVGASIRVRIIPAFQCSGRRPAGFQALTYCLVNEG